MCQLIRSSRDVGSTYIARLVFGPPPPPSMVEPLFEPSPGKLAALGSVALKATRVANINPGESITPVFMVLAICDAESFSN